MLLYIRNVNIKILNYNNNFSKIIRKLKITTIEPIGTVYWTNRYLSMKNKPTQLSGFFI